MTMAMGSGAFRREDLFNKGQPAPDAAPLVIGDWCTLNSGGMPMLVVDADEQSVWVSWRCIGGNMHETDFPRPCVRRTLAGIGRCTKCQAMTMKYPTCDACGARA